MKLSKIFLLFFLLFINYNNLFAEWSFVNKKGETIVIDAFNKEDLEEINNVNIAALQPAIPQGKRVRPITLESLGPEQHFVFKAKKEERIIAFAIFVETENPAMIEVCHCAVYQKNKKQELLLNLLNFI